MFHIQNKRLCGDRNKVRSVIVTEVNMRTAIFRDMTTCSLTQRTDISKDRAACIIIIIIISVHTHKTIQYKNQENHSLVTVQKLCLIIMPSLHPLKPSSHVTYR